jgi:hypothetical protein
MLGPKEDLKSLNSLGIGKWLKIAVTPLHHNSKGKNRMLETTLARPRKAKSERKLSFNRTKEVLNGLEIYLSKGPNHHTEGKETLFRTTAFPPMGQQDNTLKPEIF